MLSFDQARQIILDNTQLLGTEQISLADAANRVLAQDIFSPTDLPAWDNSAMDGFAVRYEDCQPGKVLKITDYIPAGATSFTKLVPGTAARIMTGAPVPDGANAIIPIEDTTVSKNSIVVATAVKKGAHIRYRGEDVAMNENILHAGDSLSGATTAILATLNITTVTVYRQPIVAILATGDELVPPGTQTDSGQIVDCNSLALAAALTKIGAKPLLLGIAKDNLHSHLEKISEGLAADAIITSAGISAGDRDYVREALNQLNIETIFWKINIKPGRPVAFARHNNRPIFSLPGNPVSTLLTFEELVKPALLKMMGHRQYMQPMFTAILRQDIKRRKDRTRFVRVIIAKGDNGYEASSAGNQETGFLSTLVRANGIAILPPGEQPIKAGEEVECHWI